MLLRGHREAARRSLSCRCIYMQEEWRLQACQSSSKQVPFFPAGPSCSLCNPGPRSARTQWKVRYCLGAVQRGEQARRRVFGGLRCERTRASSTPRLKPSNNSALTQKIPREAHISPPDALLRRQSRNVRLIGALCGAAFHSAKVSLPGRSGRARTARRSRRVVPASVCRCRPRRMGWELRGAPAERKHTKR